MTKENGFLETTIQIDKIWGNEERKEKIEKILSLFNKVVTSTYIKMEFKRRLIGDLVYTNNILQDSKNFADVFYRIKKLSPLQERKVKGVIAAFYNFFSEISNDKINGNVNEMLLEKGRTYFKRIIEMAWYEFTKDIDNVLDETDCNLAKTGPVLKGNKYDNRMKNCQSTNINCKIVEFFTSNMNYFRKVFTKLCHIGDSNLDEEQKKVKNILENVLKQPKNLADKKNCWNCGDVIIAIESPDDAKLFTTNVKHFEFICKEIDKELITV